MTTGACPTLQAFLARAASRSAAEEPLRVLWVTGGAPGTSAAAAAAAAAALASAAGGKASVACVPEECLCAALGCGGAGAGISKCILPAALIARDGSAVVGAGGLGIALEAKARGIPLVLVASAARLSPAPTAVQAVGGLGAGAGCPAAVLPLSAAAGAGACGAAAVGGLEAPSVTVVNALWDVLEAGLVGTVVTNAGVASAGTVWRLCNECYGPMAPP